MLNRLTNNWSLKLTSMVLAIVLWSHVRGEVNPWETATFRVPLRVTPPRDMVLAPDSKPPSTIRVTLRGPRLSLRQLKGSAPANPLAPADEVPLVSSEQVRVRLNFATVRKGRQEIPVIAETDIDDLEVTGVWPPNVELTLDRAESDSFSVRPQFAPSAVAGLSLSEIVVSPERASVFGPSSMLERVVTVRALADDHEVSPGALRLTRVPLVALDENQGVVDGVQVEPQFAEINATVREEQGTQQVRVVARLKGEPMDGLQVVSATVTPALLTLRGPTRVLRKLDNLRVTLDVSRAGEDITRRVEVPLPKGVRAVGSRRVTITADITRTAQVVKTPVPEASPDQVRDKASEPHRALSAPHVPSVRQEKISGDTSSPAGSTGPPGKAALPSRSTQGRSAGGRNPVVGVPALPVPAPYP